jgi:hypothetical protein
MAVARRSGLLLALLVGLAAAGGARGGDATLELEAGARLRVGLGDRAAVERDGRWTSTVAEARRLGLPLDLLEVWLPRGWEESWVHRKHLAELARQGVTPVLVHYFFGDAISRERVERERDAWTASLRRLGELARMDAPVLVVLEPEFNVHPPGGETAITDWPGFADDLRAAARMIRELAPNALVGTCPGDFPGAPNLEPMLGRVASDLDFLAFQEMRAATDPDVARPDYRRVARAALDYARYLQRAFGRPLLLGYVAVSSYGGWEEVQARALRELAASRGDLGEAGVFGLIYFQLFDDPAHTGYFGPAERFFGLVSADGREKPALDAFRQWLR